MTGYISDIFTTENHLTDSVGMVGLTATTIAVTPMMRFYKKGLYYNPEECVDSEDEPVPGECAEERGGRLSYTCVNKVTSRHVTHHTGNSTIRTESTVRRSFPLTVTFTSRRATPAPPTP